MAKKERAAISRKKAQVEEFSKEFSASKNIVIIDLRNLPDKLLQSVRKKLREKGSKIRVAQSAVMTRAMESAGKPKQLVDLFDKPAAVVTTELSPYELNKFFKENKMELAAKPGQVSPFDLIVPAGETKLPPGPALSELKSAGINAQIRGPKISIAKDSTVAKAGEAITLEKAKALQTLGIKPFTANVDILLAYDGEYVYAPDLLNISSETLSPEFVGSLQHAFNLSVNAEVPTEQNISVLLTQAFLQGANTAINGEIYSPESIELLLSRSLRAGMALSDSVPKEAAPKAEKSPDASTGEKKEEPKPEAPKAEEEPGETKAEEPKKE